MSLIDFYSQVKAAHIGLALSSGGLFALRGVAVLAGTRWGMSALLRHGSVVIDTALLIAGLLLLMMLRLNPATQPWLVLKLAVLVAYIVLGSLALKRARTWRARFVCLVGALLCFAVMLALARTRDPLGWLPAWLG